MATVRRKLESKEEDLREMKLTLRAKQEELAEMVLRKDIAEKKMKDLELTVETLKVDSFILIYKHIFPCV